MQKTLMGTWIVALCLAACLGLATTSSAAEIPWMQNLAEARKLSAQSGRPVLVHFYTNQCPPCKMLESRAFKDPALIESMSRDVIPVRINAEDQRDVADQYQVDRWPYDLYLFPDGNELYRTVSPQDPAVYCQMIARVSLRNRDWVVQQNAQYAALQRRNASTQDQRTPAAEGVAVARTPFQQVAPGQLPAPETQDLSQYPTPTLSSGPKTPNSPINQRMLLASTRPGIPSNETNDGDSRGRASGSIKSEDLPQLPTRNRYKNGPNVQAKLSQSPASNDLPPVVEGNQARRSPNPFQEQANAPAPRHQIIIPNDPTSVDNPYATPAPNGARITDNRPAGIQPSFDANISAGSPSANNQEQANPYARNNNDREPVTGSTSPNVASSLISAQHSPSLSGSQQADLENRETSNNFGQTDAIVFDGHCPVALGLRSEWKPGNARFGVRHRGRVYYCESKEAREQFLADPDKFAAVFSGYDIVRFLDSGEFVEGKREYGCWFRDQVYLFATKESCERFFSAKQAFIDEMNRIQEGAGRVAEQKQDNVRR